MEKEFVPYDLAVKLKKLGFDEPCFTKFEDYFNKTKLHPILATLHLNTPYENEYNGYGQKIINDQSKRWFFTGYKNSVKDHNNDIVSAPTFSQAFRWFREELNYEVFLQKQENLVSGKTYSFLIENDLEGIYERSLSKSSIDKAELACLTKLIEIVESKSE